MIRLLSLSVFKGVSLFMLVTMNIAQAETDEKDYWPYNVKAECKPLSAFTNSDRSVDIELVMEFDRQADRELWRSCQSDVGRYFSYRHDQFFFTCNALNQAVYLGAIGEIKKFERVAKQKEWETCMRHALKQSSGGTGEFHAFKYVLDQLLGTELEDRQEVLNELLGYAVTSLSRFPVYAEYLLDLGANAIAPTESGKSLLSWSFWMLNDGGVCGTPRALIKHMHPDDFSIQYRNRVDIDGSSEGGTHSTALMDILGFNFHCDNEVHMVIDKATNLNEQDVHGNTALHYLYRTLKRRGVYKEGLTLGHALINRDASLHIPNKDNVTPNDLRLELKNDPKLCREFCGQL